MIQGISWTVKQLQLGKVELWWERAIPHFSGERWVRPSNHFAMFSTALSFTAFLSSSISLLMLRSSFFILDEFSSDSLVLLLIWLSNSSSLLFPLILRCSSSFWFSVVHYHSRSEIQRLFVVLHSGESIPPHWLQRLESVVQLIRNPSCATRTSFFT